MRHPDRTFLSRPLSSLRGVGGHFEALAAEAGIETVRDLLWLVPDEYDDPVPPGTVADARPGHVCLLEVTVESIRSQPGRGGRRGRTEAKLRDDSGSIRAIWFNRPWVADQIGRGKSILVVGRAEGDDFIVENHEVLTGSAVGDGPPGLGLGGLSNGNRRARSPARRNQEVSVSARHRGSIPCSPLPVEP